MTQKEFDDQFLRIWKNMRITSSLSGKAKAIRI